MTQRENERKQLVFIEFIMQKVKEYVYNSKDKNGNAINWRIKAEYSTNDNDLRVITIQEQTGSKIVFYGDITPLYNYYMIDIYGLSIEECKNMSVMFSYLIGKNEYIEVINKNGNNTYKEKWQVMIEQYVNPQAIEYMDIKRIGYNSTVKCIVNKVYQEIYEGE